MFCLFDVFVFKYINIVLKGNNRNKSWEKKQKKNFRNVSEQYEHLLLFLIYSNIKIPTSTSWANDKRKNNTVPVYVKFIL